MRLLGANPVLHGLTAAQLLTVVGTGDSFADAARIESLMCFHPRIA